MRNLTLSLCAGALLAAPLAAVAAPPQTRTTARPPVISSHQIDRYDAIAAVQSALKENPKSVSDWVILGELSHEVAMDLPSDQSMKYFTMSREAFDRALELAPNKPGLKAAAQFARDQEANGAQFEKSRDRMTTTYLDARRRDLEATDYTPAVRVYSPPPLAVPTAPATADTTTPAVVEEKTPAVSPAPENSPSTAAANMGTRQYYGQPLYQPFYTAPGVSPYTYQQYSSSYYPPNYYTPAAQPMTLQRYTQQFPGAALNAAERQIIRGR